MRERQKLCRIASRKAAKPAKNALKPSFLFSNRAIPEKEASRIGRRTK
jgi:hypothetical protein